MLTTPYAAVVRRVWESLGAITIGSAWLTLSALQPSPQSQLAGALGASQVVEDVRRLSVAELLASKPVDPLIAIDGVRSLEPYVAEIRRRAEEGILSDDEWRSALAADDVIHTRARWPSGQRVALWIDEPIWLRRAIITLRAIDPPLGEVTADTTTDSNCGTMWLQRISCQRELLLEALPEGVTEIACTVTIQQLPVDTKGRLTRKGKRQLWSGLYVIPMQAVHGLEEVFPTSDSPAEIAAIRSSIRAYPRDREVGFASGVRIVVDGDHDEFPALVGLGLALEIDVRRTNKTIMALTPIMCSSGPYKPATDTNGNNAFEFPGDLIPTAATAPGWTIEIAGRLDRGLLTEWEADRWWSGSIEITLDEALQRGRND